MSKNIEEFEICYAAFVMSARTVTFVLQKEFSKNESFHTWYQKKQEVFANNKVAKFFLNQRNSIEKEGINALEFSMKIDELHLPSDAIDKPENSEIQISAKGIFYLVNKGTQKEDLLPAKIKGIVTVCIFFLIDGQVLNVLDISEAYYKTLKELVEEWTGIMNKA